MVSLEMKYARIDQRRLREFVTTGITKETAQEYTSVVRDMERAYKKHEWILAARAQERKEIKTPAVLRG
jgi:hypothetical protein